MIRNTIAYLDMKQEHITKLLLTIKQQISKSYNPVFQGKTKHFNVKFILVKRRATIGWCESGFCKIEDQSTDMFKMSFPLNEFEYMKMKVIWSLKARRGVENMPQYYQISFLFYFLFVFLKSCSIILVCYASRVLKYQFNYQINATFCT